MKARLGLVLTVVVVLSSMAVQAVAVEKAEKGGKEVTITLKQLPKTVKATLLHEVGKGKIDEIEKATSGKTVTYSADITKAGKHYDVEIAANGKLIKVEEDKPGEKEHEGKNEKDEEANEVKVTLKDLPAAVRATLQKEAGSGTIDEIEKGVEKGKTIYSADITKNGKKYDVDIAADGKLLKTEVEKPKKAEAKEGDEKDEKGEKD